MKIVGTDFVSRPTDGVDKLSVVYFTAPGRVDFRTLVGELALPEQGEPVATIVCLHPLPTHGGMMDSHVFRKAAFRLPALAGVAVRLLDDVYDVSRFPLRRQGDAHLRDHRAVR